MPDKVDITLLRQMTASAMRVYEACGQAGLLTAEGRRALAASEGLLKATTGAFLPPLTAINEHLNANPRDGMLTSYSQVQRSLAQLQDALYSYIQARAGAHDWDAALQGHAALARVDPGYRDLPGLRQKIEEQRSQYQQQLAEAGKRRIEDEKRRLEQERIRKRLEQMETARKQPDVSINLRGEIIQMRPIPAGEFLAEDGKKEIRVEGFLMAKYPVTNAQFAAFEDAAGCEKRADRSAGKSNHPVANVNWHDANTFCRWAGQVSGKVFRLPSDLEWEKAARGTDGREYPWGNEPPDASRCNFNNLVRETTSVGKYSPRGDSPFGCCDMSGNVWEWCADDNQNGKSLRGGAFIDNAPRTALTKGSGPQI